MVERQSCYKHEKKWGKIVGGGDYIPPIATMPPDFDINHAGEDDRQKVTCTKSSLSFNIGSGISLFIYRVNSYT